MFKTEGSYSMLNHIALMTFKDELSDSGKRIAAVKLKSGLEGLAGKVDGLLDISVENILLNSSTADILLFCRLEDESALENLKNTPLLFNIKSVIDESLARVHTASYYA